MTNSMIWIITASFIGLYVLYMLFAVIRRNKNKNKEWEDRVHSVSGHSTSPQKVQKKSIHSLIKEREQSKSRRKGRMTSKIVRVTSLRHWLHYTGYNISPWVLYTVVTLLVLIATYALYEFLEFNIILSFLGSLIVVSLLCYLIIQYLVERRKSAFLDVFPDALDLIRRALRAGYAADRSVVMAADESPEPVKSAFQNVIDRLSIGQPLEEALTEVANEVGVDEFHMLAIVLVLQRDTGGSLADVVDNFSKIMRERIRLKKKVKSITAEGKASGYFVSAVPFGIILILSFISPEYLEPLFTTPQGKNILMLGGGLMATGMFVIYRMVNKDFY